ncbi:MAG: hypothetical protein WBM04_07050 [Candidatus Korobacteraceae bacterium]
MLLISSAAFSQQASTQQQALSGVQNYAPYSIALLPSAPGGEVVLPFLTTENKVEFFPLSQVQLASKEKRLLGRPISYGEVVVLIGQLQIEVNRLKEENEKLWTAVGKPSVPPTVIVQTPPTQSQRTNSDALTKYLLLRQLFPSSQPYQIPKPVAPNNGVNCTTTYVGTTAYTNCH